MDNIMERVVKDNINTDLDHYLPVMELAPFIE
jgi:hypothetical protein